MGSWGARQAAAGGRRGTNSSALRRLWQRQCGSAEKKGQGENVAKASSFVQMELEAIDFGCTIVISPVITRTYVLGALVVPGFPSFVYFAP